MSKEPHPLWSPVRKILWSEWDPIGCGVPEDEYDGYVWITIAKIMRSEGEEAIADYLDWGSNEHMGCPQPRSRNLEVAAKLAHLRSPE